MVFKTVFVQPTLPEKLKKLYTLAYNIWSLWDVDAIKLFQRISLEDFQKARKNPVRFLHTLPQEKLEQLNQDEGFLYELDRVYEKYKDYLKFNDPRYKELKGKIVAYFSMEYGLHWSLPNYAGGLGLLSGDHMKGASDLGLPLIGIGLFYKYGYFTQNININGYQEEIFSENIIYYLPIKELKEEDGKPVYIEISILDKTIKVKVWHVYVGRIMLLLLDTNIDDNPPEFKDITDYLYVANREKRILQEIVLGYGGTRALEKMGITPDAFHLNEGHSAFLIIERLRKLILKEGYSFNKAFAFIKSTSIFTTHTPVEAGNENFPVGMIKKYLQKDIEELKIPFDDFIKFGLLHDGNTFWMPALAIRFSAYINGVSHLHSEVSKKMWQKIFHQRTLFEIPITYITNGAHFSWKSSLCQDLFKRYINPEFFRCHCEKELWDNIYDIPDEELWDMHLRKKHDMIRAIRKDLISKLATKGYSPLRIKKESSILSANFLTIGFARRFATYKRGTLILKDKQRLKKILTNPERPVQLLFAGKAHPADMAGKNIIKEIIDFAKEYDVRDRVLFIEDYDIETARFLVQGCDVWLNNPIKPREASGTSGMKAGMNGVINLSVLDGWWDECYDEKNGWAITAGEQYSNDEMRDMADANQIYDLLENEITPLFYDRDENNVPTDWIKVMKNSMYTVSLYFNINRMLDEYTMKFYIPAVKYSKELLKDDLALLNEIEDNFIKVKKYWDKIYMKDLFTNIKEKAIVTTEKEITFDCYIYLDDMNPELVNVEIFYIILKDKYHEIVTLNLMESYKDKTAKYIGKLKLKSSGIQNYNVRVVPRDENIRRLYPELIKWLDK